MRKLTLLAATLFTIALISSCNETCGPFPNDDSVAGSISFNYPNVVIEASYDGVPILADPSDDVNIMRIGKVSHTGVLLYYYIGCSDTVRLHIPYIPVAGIPYKATLNYESDNAKVEYGGIAYYPAVTTINGWITEARYLVQTRCSPSKPWYKFEVNIDCILEEGRTLRVKATSSNPWGA